MHPSPAVGAAAEETLTVDKKSFDPYEQAITRLALLRENKKLSATEAALITEAKGFEDVLRAVQDAQIRHVQEREAVNKFLFATSGAVLVRLDRFSKAIDMMVQSTKIAALLWGSMRFIITVGNLSLPSFLQPWLTVLILRSGETFLKLSKCLSIP
jgi:hypothetical protein